MNEYGTVVEKYGQETAKGLEEKTCPACHFVHHKFQSEKLVSELWYGSVFAFGECITRNNCGLGTDKTFPLFSSRAPCAKNTQKRISDPLLELI